MVEFRRKLYKRGSSFETTIPMPLLFALDNSRKYDVVFSYSTGENQWKIRIDERSAEAAASPAGNRGRGAKPAAAKRKRRS